MKHLHKGDYVKVLQDHRFKGRCGPIVYKDDGNHEERVYGVRVQAKHGPVTIAKYRADLELVRRGQECKN